METIVITALTEEEYAAVQQKRQEEENENKARYMLDDVKKALAAINELGYKVRLPEIGGRYISRTEQEVNPKKLTLTKW
jgi:predicted SprT family Zn-dependent metalloprotease